MAKQIETVLVNGTQFATFEALKEQADKNGVIKGTVVDGYKNNVIQALVSREIIKLFRGRHYKVNPSLKVEQRPDHTPRVKKEVANVEQEVVSA